MIGVTKKSICREVNACEMMYYREQGLRNSEIAKLLGTSTVTIRKYIGSDGTRGRPPKYRDNKPIDK